MRTALLLGVLVFMIETAEAQSFIGDLEQLSTDIDSETENGEESEEEAEGFKGNAALGYLASSGNTESASLNVQLTLSHDIEKWRHFGQLLAVQSTEDDETTGERYNLVTKSDYKLGHASYVFFAFGFDRDRFSGVEQRVSGSVGYGGRMLDREKHELDGSAGLGFRESKFSDGRTEREAILRLGLNYAWQINENSQFTQSLVVEEGDSNTYVETVSALTATLVGDLAVNLSYTVKRNSDAPPGSVKTDKYASVSLQYSF